MYLFTAKLAKNAKKKLGALGGLRGFKHL